MPGTLTEITYWSDLGIMFTGSFAYLPGDVNGDRLTAIGDINALIDCLNYTVAPPCEIWQTDIDRSGLPGASDILREIDLLNGASPFDTWITETVPFPGSCP